mgnify:CR=1 FL=1
MRRATVADDPKVKVLPAAGVSFAVGSNVLRGSACDDAEADADRLAEAANLDALLPALYGFRCVPLGGGIDDIRADADCPLCTHVVALRTALAAHEARRKGRTP